MPTTPEQRQEAQDLCDWLSADAAAQERFADRTLLIAALIVAALLATGVI